MSLNGKPYGRGISIHALREESDPVDYAVLEIHNISIHALREESDTPTASNGGVYALFQSTLSARRATSNYHR